MLRPIQRIILLFVLCLFLVSWGNKGHYAINKKCPESFPASMVAFQVWSDSLASLGSEADNRKSRDPNEKPKHYIDIDNYAEFNSTGRIASTYDSIVNIHDSSFVKTDGTLPWATLNMYDTLKVAFEQKKWHKAMLCAADLGHYVGDGHMPLHLTANYDGRMTGQSGLHSRYESSMVYTFLSSLTSYTGKPIHMVSNVNKYIFDYIYINHQYVDSVLAADVYAKTLAGNTTSSQYYTALWNKTHFTTTLFHNASHALADLIYTAWIEAGSPAFGIVNSMANSGDGNNVSVFPNPTTGKVKLTGDNIFKTEVSDITGKSQGLFYDKHLDLFNLSNGMYILSIYGKDGLLKKEKILLNK